MMNNSSSIHKRTRNDFEKEPKQVVKKTFFENSFDQRRYSFDDWKQLDPVISKINEVYSQHLNENIDFTDSSKNKEFEQNSFLKCYKIKKYMISQQVNTLKEHYQQIKIGILKQIDYVYAIEDDTIIFFPLSRFLTNETLLNGLFSSSFNFEKNIVDVALFEQNTTNSKQFTILIAYSKSLNFHDLVINSGSPIFIDTKSFQMIKIEDGIKKLVIHHDNIYYLTMNNILKRILNKKEGNLSNVIDFFQCNLNKLKTEFNVIFNERKKLRKLIYDEKKFLFFVLLDSEKKQEISIYFSSLKNLISVGTLCLDSLNEKLNDQYKFKVESIIDIAVIDNSKISIVLTDNNGNRIYISLIYIYCPKRSTYVPTKNFEIHSFVCFPMLEKDKTIFLDSFINENHQVLIEKIKDEKIKISFISSYKSSKQSYSSFEVMTNIFDQEKFFIDEIFKNNRKYYLFHFNTEFFLVNEKNSFDYILEFFESNQEKNLQVLQGFLKENNVDVKQAFLEYFFNQNYEAYDEEIRKFFWVLGFQIGNNIFFEFVQLVVKTIGSIYEKKLIVLSNKALKFLIEKLEKIYDKEELVRSSIKNDCLTTIFYLAKTIRNILKLIFCLNNFDNNNTKLSFKDDNLSIKELFSTESSRNRLKVIFNRIIKTNLMNRYDDLFQFIKINLSLFFTEEDLILIKSEILLESALIQTDPAEKNQFILKAINLLNKINDIDNEKIVELYTDYFHKLGEIPKFINFLCRILGNVPNDEIWDMMEAKKENLRLFCMDVLMTKAAEKYKKLPENLYEIIQKQDDSFKMSLKIIFEGNDKKLINKVLQWTCNDKLYHELKNINAKGLLEGLIRLQEETYYLQKHLLIFDFYFNNFMFEDAFKTGRELILYKTNFFDDKIDFKNIQLNESLEKESLGFEQKKILSKRLSEICAFSADLFGKDNEIKASIELQSRIIEHLAYDKANEKYLIIRYFLNFNLLNINCMYESIIVPFDFKYGKVLYLKLAQELKKYKENQVFEFYFFAFQELLQTQKSKNWEFWREILKKTVKEIYDPALSPEHLIILLEHFNANFFNVRKFYKIKSSNKIFWISNFVKNYHKDEEDIIHYYLETFKLFLKDRQVKLFNLNLFNNFPIFYVFNLMLFVVESYNEANKEKNCYKFRVAYNFLSFISNNIQILDKESNVKNQLIEDFKKRLNSIKDEIGTEIIRKNLLDN